MLHSGLTPPTKPSNLFLLTSPYILICSHVQIDLFYWQTNLVFSISLREMFWNWGELVYFGIWTVGKPRRPHWGGSKVYVYKQLIN